MAVEIIKRRFTVDDYLRMGQTGILSEDDHVELIDGEVVVMSPIGLPHLACVDRINRVLVLKLREHGIVRVQVASCSICMTRRNPMSRCCGRKQTSISPDIRIRATSFC